MWELCDSTGPVRHDLDETEARGLVYANADPSVYARKGRAEIRWDDVKDTPPPTEVGAENPGETLASANEGGQQ